MAMATDSLRLFPPLSSHAYRASQEIMLDNAARRDILLDNTVWSA